MKRKVVKNCKSIIALFLVVAMVIPDLSGFTSAKAATYDEFYSSKELQLSFDGNLTDSSVNNIGVTTNSGGTAQYTDGISGQALHLDGSYYLDLGTSADLQPSNLTVSFWIRPTGTMSGENMIMWNKPDGTWNGDGWYLSSLSDSTPLKLSVGSTDLEEFYVSASRSDFFPLNEWTHIVVTFDDTTKTAQIYRNGVKQAVSKQNNTTSPAIVGNSTDHKYLGDNSPIYGGAYAANFDLDEYGIYSTVANQTQVDDLFSEYSDFNLSKELDLSFENNLTDTSDNTIGVTPNSGGTPVYTDGISGQALRLDGNYYLDLGTSSALQPANLTVSFWIRPTEALSGENMIMWNKPDGTWNGNGWYLSSLDDNTPLKLSVGSTGLEEYYVTATRSDFFPLNEWTHVVVTFDETTKAVKMYRNGVEQTVKQVNNSTTASIVGNDTDHKYLGDNSPIYGGNYAKFDIDEYQIFSSVATQDDVTHLHDIYTEVDPQTIVDADYDSLAFSTTSIKSDLTLSNKGINGSTITWSSSNTNYIADDGRVTRPSAADGDQTVTMTATLTFGTATRTKTFDFTVVAESGIAAGKELQLSFENNADDSTGKNTPSVVGTADYVDGISGNALRLNGSTYLDLGTSAALQPTNLTVSFWVRTTSALTGENMIMWNKPSGSFQGNGWYLSSLDDATPLKLSVGPSTGVPYEAYVSGSRSDFFPVNEWVHVVVTFDSTTKEVHIYRNGISQTVSYLNSADNAVITGTTDHKYLGFNSPGYNGGFSKMDIDEYAIYSETATSADAKEMYAQYAVVDYEQLAQDDYNALRIQTSNVTSNLALPTVGSKGESTISWASSNEAVISTTGVVTRPLPGVTDAVVTLTATITNGTYSLTKTFVVTVPAISDLTDISNFGLGDVEVTDEYLTNAFDKEIAYLESLDVNKFLAGFRETAGLDMQGATRYGGWENSLIGGHAFGHYMSAISQAYASLDESSPDKAILKAKIDSIVDGLKACQDATGTGFIFGATIIDTNNIEKQFDNVEANLTNITTQAWVPWYTMHKILAGLIDIYKNTGDTDALAIATKLGDWVYNRTSTWSTATQLTVLNIEYGGMNDSLYDLYKITGDADYATAAHMFDETVLFDKVLSGDANVLNGLHANTTIPKFLGALNRYEVLDGQDVNGETIDADQYLEYAKAFWDMVVNRHTYVTGGNSEWEHFGADYVLDSERTNANDETCNVYNMLKLSRKLFEITGDRKYFDYYENTFVNSILSSQNPETGMTTYFQPMDTGFFKVFSSPTNSFWCCTGSGMENFSKLNDSIYFYKDNTLYVNQFISSVLNWSTQGVTVTQDTNMYGTGSDDSVTDTTKLTIDTNGIDKQFAIRVRIPDWTAGTPVITVNGAAINPTVTAGYAVINRTWSDGDVLEVKLPQELTVATLPDNDSVYAFKYGPIVLSAELGTTSMTTTTTGVSVTVPATKVVSSEYVTVNGSVADYLSNISDNLVKTTGKLEFTLKNTDQSLVFTPHYQQYTQRYGIYWYLASNSDEEASILAQKQAGREAKALLDTVQPGYGQYENDDLHQMAEENSVGNTGTVTSRYAEAGGYFSYRMIVNPDKSNYLLCTFSKDDNGKPIVIYAGDTVIYNDVLNYDGDDDTYQVKVSIPDDVLKANVTATDANGNSYQTIRFRFEGTDTEASAKLINFLYTKTEYDTDPSISELTFDVGTLTKDGNTYTLTVPTSTTSVSMTLKLADYYGLLYVGGKLVDDTKAQAITLSGDKTTVTLVTKAEDHETSLTTTLNIVKSDGSTSSGTNTGSNSSTGSTTGSGETTQSPETGSAPIWPIGLMMVASGTTFVLLKRRRTE